MRKIMVILALMILAHPGFAQGIESIAPEKFAPSLGRAGAGGTLELRAEATVYGAEVRLKQVARWSATEDGFFSPIGDLVLMRLGEGSAFRSLSLIELKNRLRDAGVNLAVIRFAGATACTVGRGDVAYDEHAALQQWAEARSARLEATQPPIESPGVAPHAHRDPPTVHAAPVDGARSLRRILVEDLSVRLGVEPDMLQIDFSPRDEKLLGLTEGTFGFQVTPRRASALGRVEWDVALVRGEEVRKVPIVGMARLWQQQVVVARAVAYRQVIRDGDLTERSALIEQMPGGVLLTREQVVHQQAAMDLKPGTVLTARMVDPVPLVRQGQLVTVTINAGAVAITSVGRAMEQGAFGQTVRVRNEATREVYEVTVTGPQTAKMGTRGSQVASGY